MIGPLLPLVILLITSCSENRMHTNHPQSRLCMTLAAGDTYRWCYLVRGETPKWGVGQVGDAAPEECIEELHLLVSMHDGILIGESFGRTNWIEFCQYNRGKKDGEYFRLGEGGRIIKRRLYRNGTATDGTWWHQNGGLWCNIVSNGAGFRVTLWDQEGSIYTDGVRRDGKENGSFAYWIYGGVPYISSYSNGYLINVYKATNGVSAP